MNSPSNPAIQTLKDAGTIVIKIGSVLVRDAQSHDIRRGWFDAFADDVHVLVSAGKHVVIVSSGAVAMGRKAVGIGYDTPPSKIPLEQKQAASAVGQFYVYAAYNAAFFRHNMETAQVLLTISETENRRMHLNARATLQTLLDKNIVPVINENDTVSTGELRFGDNDRLAVRVAQMIDADAVVLLSTADGLFTDDPNKNKDAKHIALVEKIGADHVAMAGEAIAGLSTGGMKSKVEAALSASKAGIPLIITSGMDTHALRDLCHSDSKRATLFRAQETRANARKIWIQAHLRPKGTLVIDDGAAAALQSGRSLLPVGVKRSEGRYERGDVVVIQTLSGAEIGKGISAYDWAEAEKILGRPTSEIETVLDYVRGHEIIHRNDMVLNAT